jgi:hypothetical protein
MELLNKNGIIEMIAAVKAGKITVVRDEYGNVRCINCNRPGLQVQDIKYTKNVCGGTAVGSSPEDLEEDVKAIRKFMEDWGHTNVMHLAVIAERINKPELTDEDVAYLNEELQRYVERNTKVITREVKVPVDRPVETAKRGKYPDLFENLYVLDVETLKEMKRVATRNGADDLKNACRTVLRHKGYNC